jgi:hypothetical protein
MVAQQVAIGARSRGQDRGGAVLDDATVVEDEDLVGLGGRVEVVRDDQDASGAREPRGRTWLRP